MKKLKTVFKAKLVRSLFGNNIINHESKEYDNYPTEDELLEFLGECNEGASHKDFETKITVDKVYKVVDVDARIE